MKRLSFNDIFTNDFADLYIPEKNNEKILLEKDDKGNYFFEIDLPGFKKEDLSIKVKDKIVYIEGERKGNKSCTYEKQIAFPKSIMVESAQAELVDGVLKVTFLENKDVLKEIAVPIK